VDAAAVGVPLTCCVANHSVFFFLLSSEAEALELKEEFARRLGEQQRTIDILKVLLAATASTAEFAKAAWTNQSCGSFLCSSCTC
jgi:hypothetical protein